MEGQLVFDVSTLVARSDVRPTGIDRVTLETALALIDVREASVSFCRFDRAGGTYEQVSSETVRALAVRIRGDERQPMSERTSDSRRPMDYTTIRDFSKKALDRAMRRLPAARTHFRLALGHGRRAVVQASLGIRAAGKELASLGGPTSSPCYSDSWGPDTTYCSMGMDFAHNDLTYLRAQRGRQRFRVAIMVHDLIPAVAPQYSTIDLSPYFEELLAVCDVALVNSDATAHDLHRFAGDRKVQVPPTVKVPLGSALADLDARRPAEIPDSIESSGFVLTVGTVTIRKNHHLLLDVWLHLLADLGPDRTPGLVIAGTRGSVSAETLSRLDRDPLLRSVVHHIEDASDAEIAWLYRRCKFTLYPSLYEGWGLPVTESHDFGKVCIASDRTSLPEAGGGLAIHLDPLDRAGWRESIMSLWLDAALRRDLEQRIARLHKRVTAVATAETIASLTSSGDDARESNAPSTISQEN